MSDPKETETKADDQTEAEPEADRKDTQPTPSPETETGWAYRILGIIDNLPKAERKRLLAALRALYGSEQ